MYKCQDKIKKFTGALFEAFEKIILHSNLNNELEIKRMGSFIIL